MTIARESIMCVCWTCHRTYDALDPRAKHDLTHCSRHKITHDRDRCSRCQRIAAYWGEGPSVPAQGEAPPESQPAASQGHPQQMELPWV